MEQHLTKTEEIDMMEKVHKLTLKVETLERKIDLKRQIKDLELRVSQLTSILNNSEVKT